MLAEQGLLGDLMEENMTIKKPGGNATAGPKIAKKALLKVSEKKKKARIKKRGKKWGMFCVIFYILVFLPNILHKKFTAQNYNESIQLQICVCTF